MFRRSKSVSEKRQNRKADTSGDAGGEAVAAMTSSHQASERIVAETPTIQQQPGSQQNKGVSVRHVNRLDVNEVFIDTISGVVFDGQTLRVEGAVTRLEVAPDKRSVVASKYTACRLVLSPNAGAELINQLQQVTTRVREAAAQRAEQSKAVEAATPPSAAKN
jgi:hypothetical protein